MKRKRSQRLFLNDSDSKFQDNNTFVSLSEIIYISDTNDELVTETQFIVKDEPIYIFFTIFIIIIF
jgi:hypothetical protein